MTSSPTPSELLAIRTGNAALLNSPDASVDMVATIVFALGAAGLLASPEQVAEVENLRARVAELLAQRDDLLVEATTTDEDSIAFVPTGPECPEHPGTLLINDSCKNCAWHPWREDPHDSPLRRDYRKCRDLPLPGVTA